APLHVLVIPKTHIASLNDVTSGHDGLIGEMNRRAAVIARDRGYADRGFRTVFNTNREAGQTVFHIHLHLLAGRSMEWPPGSSLVVSRACSVVGREWKAGKSHRWY